MEVLRREGFHQIAKLAQESGSDGPVDHLQVKALQQNPGQQLAKWTRRLDLADRAVLRVAGE